MATSAATPKLIASKQVATDVGRSRNSFQIKLRRVMSYFPFLLWTQFGSSQHLPAACSSAAISSLVAAAENFPTNTPGGANSDTIEPLAAAGLISMSDK